MQTGKITALYVRFSYDDGIDAESGCSLPSKTQKSDTQNAKKPL